MTELDDVDEFGDFDRLAYFDQLLMLMEHFPGLTRDVLMRSGMTALEAKQGVYNGQIYFGNDTDGREILVRKFSSKNTSPPTSPI